MPVPVKTSCPAGEILKDAELRLQQGAGNARDVARILATSANIEVRLAVFEREALVAEARYEDYFGEVMSREYRPPINLIRRTLETLMAIAERSNPRLRRAILFDRQQEASHKAERLDWFPKIFAEIAATKFDVGKNNGDFAVTGRLSVRHSIFTGGGRKARRNQSSARARQAKFEADAMRKTVKRNLAQLNERFGALLRQENILAKAVSANGASRRLLMEQFRTSRGTVTELLDAEAGFFQSSAEYLNNKVDSDLSFLELLFETGELLDLIGFPARS